MEVLLSCVVAAILIQSGREFNAATRMASPDEDRCVEERCMEKKFSKKED